MKRIFVYDIESLSNCFTVTFLNRKTKEIFQFIIHESQNDYLSLLVFLKEVDILIGYNNIRYDYPVIHRLLVHKSEYSRLSGESLAREIYRVSQEVISNNYPEIRNPIIEQIDPFLIWHFDNLAKLTSLKALEIALNMDKVEDMPFNHWDSIKKEDIVSILSYNLNDVLATDYFFDITLGRTDNVLYKGKDKLNLRLILSNKLKVPMMNYNDIKIGTELFLQLYCNRFKKNINDVRKLRTYRPYINISDCIPEWINFKAPEFNILLDKFKSVTIKETKGFSESVIIHGIKIDYGLGGAHASIKPSLIEQDNDLIILDGDVNSLYPSLGISLGIYPQHLGKEFIDIYDGEIVSVRLAEKAKPKTEQDLVIVEGYKLAANGIFGKSNSPDSYLYDPLYTMKTTIGGQLFISMWVDMLIDRIPEIQFLQLNTDGISVKIPKNKLDIYYGITTELTNLTKLTFEFAEYKKMVIMDVNNYIAEYSSGKIKYKGLFEIDKELHKDHSMKIVPIALREYFLHNIPIEQTIFDHKNIYDFCLRLKINSGFKGEYHYIDYSEEFPKKAIINLSKNTRYFISKKGGSLYKNKDSKMTGVNIGYLTTLFNDYKEFDYNINYRFYINECNKIINVIEDKQLSLF